MKKVKNISVRMEEREYRAIKAKEETANTSLSRYLIETALGARESDLRLRSDLAAQLCQLQNLLLTASDYEHLRNGVVSWRGETIRRIGD